MLGNVSVDDVPSSVLIGVAANDVVVVPEQVYVVGEVDEAVHATEHVCASSVKPFVPVIRLLPVVVDDGVHVDGVSQTSVPIVTLPKFADPPFLRLATCSV